MDPSRGRYPIKLYRNDSPASTLSSRRPSHRSEYPGYPSTAHRATSEPPPEGPIQLHRMDLIRSPSRTYFEPPTMPPDYPFYHMGPPPGYYRTVRHRYYEPSGYESDATRVYPPPSRPIFRSDGYETDSGLISSGRIRMSRPVPTMSASTSRMAVIPETNRIHPNREKRDFNQMEHEIPVQRQTRTRSEDFDRQRVQREPITPAVVIPIQTEDEQKVKPWTCLLVITNSSSNRSKRRRRKKIFSIFCPVQSVSRIRSILERRFRHLRARVRNRTANRQ